MSVNYVFSQFSYVFKLFFFNLKMDSSPAKGLHPLCCSAYSLLGFIKDQGTNRHTRGLNTYTHLFSSLHKLFFLTVAHMHHLWFLRRILAPGDRIRRKRGENTKPNPCKTERNTCSVRAHSGTSAFLSPQAPWVILSISSRYKSLGQPTGVTITAALKDWLISPASICLQFWLSDKSSQINLYPKG